MLSVQEVQGDHVEVGLGTAGHQTELLVWRILDHSGIDLVAGNSLTPVYSQTQNLLPDQHWGQRHTLWGKLSTTHPQELPLCSKMSEVRYRVFFQVQILDVDPAPFYHDSQGM